MKTKITDKKRKILRRIFGALSLSSALFIFQACYGTPGYFGADLSIQGFVKSKTTHLPIPGIKVSITNQPQYEITDNTGKFKIYTTRESEYYIKFEDIDDIKNGAFLPKDTVLNIVNESTLLNVYLNDK
jgi:hypothetical protein